MKKILMFLTCIPLTLSAGLFSNYSESNSNYECCEETDSSFFQVGFGYEHLKFTPHDNPSFSGNLYGAQAKYEYKPCNGLYEAVKFNWRNGNIHGSGANRRINDYDTQGRIGFSLSPLWQCLSITPFTGFGWRNIEHKLHQPNLLNLEFDYNEVYIPVGLLVDLALSECLYVGLSTTWMPQVFSNVNIIPLNNIRWTLQNTTSNVLIELPITYNFCYCDMNWYLNFSPNFQYWQDGKSLASTTSGLDLGLPENDYIFWGFELNVGCSF